MAKKKSEKEMSAKRVAKVVDDLNSTVKKVKGKLTSDVLSVVEKILKISIILSILQILSGIVDDEIR